MGCLQAQARLSLKNQQLRIRSRPPSSLRQQVMVPLAQAMCTRRPCGGIAAARCTGCARPLATCRAVPAMPNPRCREEASSATRWPCTGREHASLATCWLHKPHPLPRQTSPAPSRPRRSLVGLVGHASDSSATPDALLASLGCWPLCRLVGR